MVGMSHSDTSIADVLRRGDERQAEAYRVIAALDLLQRWSAHGRPVVVGSVAYGLVVEPDVDLEIYCPRPRVEDGFVVISELALQLGVWKIRFSNELQEPDPGLYWLIRYSYHAS